jgi:hypothetical protein
MIRILLFAALAWLAGPAVAGDQVSVFGATKVCDACDGSTDHFKPYGGIAYTVTSQGRAGLFGDAALMLNASHFSTGFHWGVEGARFHVGGTLVAEAAEYDFGPVSDLNQALGTGGMMDMEIGQAFVRYLFYQANHRFKIRHNGTQYSQDKTLRVHVLMGGVRF